MQPAAHHTSIHRYSEGPRDDGISSNWCLSILEGKSRNSSLLVSNPYGNFWAWTLLSQQGKMRLGVRVCLRASKECATVAPLKSNLNITLSRSPRTWIISWRNASVSVKFPAAVLQDGPFPHLTVHLLTLRSLNSLDWVWQPLVEMTDSAIYYTLELPAAPQVQDESGRKPKGEFTTSAPGPRASGEESSREDRVQETRTVWRDALGFSLQGRCAMWTFGVERSCDLF